MDSTASKHFQQFRSSFSNATSDSFTTKPITMPVSHFLLYDEPDLQTQKQYLAKLRSQRQKTQKLYEDYLLILNQRDQCKKECKNLEKTLRQQRNKYSKDSEEKLKHIKTLQQAKKSLKTQLQEMYKEKTKNLQQIKNYYTSLYEPARTQIEQLKIQLQTKTEKVKQIYFLLEKKTTQIQKVNSILFQKSKEIKQVQDHYKSIIQQLQNKCKTISSENSQLARKLQEFDSEGNKFNVQKLKSQLQFRTQQYETMKKFYDNSKQQEKNQQQTINKLKARIQQEQTEKQKILCENISINNKFKELIQKHEQIKGRFLKDNQSIKNNYQSKIRELEKDRNRLKQSITQLENQKKKYIIRIEEWERTQSQKISRQQYEQHITIKIELQKQVNILQTTNRDLLDEIEKFSKMKQQYKMLKQENQTLYQFIKQKQVLERERRSLVQSELKQIQKFQKILKNVE